MPSSSGASTRRRRASASSASDTSGCPWPSRSRRTGSIPDVAADDLGAVVGRKMLRATTDMSELADMDVIDIAVPTPLRKTKDPDLSYVVQAVEACAATLRPGQLIILESTTYPGTTDEVVQP